MNHLRHLSLFIDEPDHDDFYWVILESKHDVTVWEEHSSSMHGYKTWKEAWVAGSVQYMKLVKDPRVGPRANGEDEDAAPVG